MASALAYHKWFQANFDLLKFFLVHGTDLSNTKSHISFCNKFLVILIENFFRCFILQIASSLEHFSCEIFNLNVRDQCKRTCCDLVLLGAGWGTEH